MVDASGQGTAPFNDRNVSLEALAESEQRSRTLVEALPDAILVHREDKIVFVNPFCVRLLGAAGPEQLLGKDINEIVNPDDLPAIRNRIQDCYASGTASPPMESVLIACDGSSVEIEAVAIPIRWNGAPAIEVVARDIRDRKRAERAVQDWQERLVLAQKAGLRIGLWDWDAVANTVIWSDETYRQFGYTQDTFSGRVEDAVTRIHSEDRPRVEDAIRKVIAGGGEYAQQYRLVWPNGTTCWVDAHGVMVRNGSTHMLGIGVDITDLKKTEQSLQESEEKYLLLLNSAAEAIYGLDLEGDCTFCNPACLRLLGYGAPKDLIGTNMHELMHHTRADGTPYPKQDCEIYVAVREGRASHITDEVLWRADGTSFPSEYWSYPIYKAGDLVGAVVSFLDISDRKRAEQTLRQSEEKYRELFENATYGIFRSQLDGALLDVNPALVAMLGYSSKEELLTRNLSRDLYEEPADRRSILDSYGPTGRVRGCEVNWKRKDGKIIVVRISGGAFRRQDGSFSHFEVIVEDITERRSLEAQFRQAQRMEAVGRLAGGIAHDFNNLLMVMGSSAELAQDLIEDKELGSSRKYLKQIRESVEKAARLTRQLLAFSRQQVLQPTVLDLNVIINDLSKMTVRLLGEDIKVELALDPDLGRVEADRGQIEQVIMNLAVNARDAMPDGGKLTLGTFNTEVGVDNVDHHKPAMPAGSYVTLSISDTGIGMSAEVQSHIFEPFFTTKEIGKGTGLGLSTVYGIVKQSNGWIWVYSEPANGTVFKIYLPRVNKSPVAEKPVEEAGSLAGTETVLFVEDDDALREPLVNYLSSKGYRVIEATDGPTALEKGLKEEGVIDILVTDLIMPGFGGVKLAESLRQSRPNLRVIFISGYTDRTNSIHEYRSSSSYLQKPFGLDALARAIRATLTGR